MGKYNDKIYIFGGLSTIGKHRVLLNDLLEIDIDGKINQQSFPENLIPRVYNQSSCIFGKYMIISGGINYGE